MNQRRRRFSPSDSFASENLEGRVVLSAITFDHITAQVAARSARQASTQTGMTITSGTLGQPVTFDVIVRGSASLGSPHGTVNLIDHGKVIQTLTLSPSDSPGGKYAYSTASYAVIPQPGGTESYYFGRHTITAQYVPSGPFHRSSVTKSFPVAQPPYTPIGNGVKVATIVNGSGPTVESGQAAEVLYTGYLSKKGKVFDASSLHGNEALKFTLGASQVIPGFDAGITGMQVGETRIIEIPPSQGYGAFSNGSIPANSTLVFVVTLAGIG